MVISTAVRSSSTVLEANVYLFDIFFWLFENQAFNIPRTCFRNHKKQPNKQKNNNHNLQRVSWDLFEI